jgi:P-type E1-E2 ATPase
MAVQQELMILTFAVQRRSSLDAVPSGTGRTSDRRKACRTDSIRDEIRPESPATIRRLRDLGIREVILLSGDTEWTARSIASQLAVDRYFATASPVEKVDLVQRLQREGRVVAMVGDGMNDGPALRYANVGIAVKHGAELAHDSAGALLTDTSLAGLVKAIEIARSSLARIQWGYAIVAVWNFQALLFALTGMVISPAVTPLVSDGSAILAGIYGMQPLWRRGRAYPSQREAVTE